MPLILIYFYDLDRLSSRNRINGILFFYSEKLEFLPLLLKIIEVF